MLTFTWTVAKGDNDPDGIRIESIDPRGASIRFAAGCTDDLPCEMDVPTFESDHAQRYPQHRVRGGLHAMRFVVSEYDAREGEPFTVTVQRDGGFDELAHAIVRMTDSGVEKLTDDVSNLTPEELQEVRDYAPRLLSFPFDEASREQADPKVSVQTVTPPGDGEANAERTLTFELIATDVGDNNGGHSYWYETRAPVEVTVPVTDTGLAGGAPDSPSLGVWDDWTQEPTQEQWDRGTRFPLRFDVTVPWPNVLRPRGDGTVTVQYETRNGTAVADSDYVATSGTLTFEAGETRKTVEVEVMADPHDEGEETLTLVLSNATGALIVQAEATGTIRNNGLIPKVWIARFGRTVAEQMLEAVEGRMRAAPAPGVEVSLAGEQIGWQPEPGSEAERLTDWLNSETDDQAAQHQSRAVTSRDLLTGSSFTLTEETPGRGPGLVLGPGRGHALRRARGRSDAGRRGRDRHARRRLEPGTLDHRADSLPQQRRGQLPRRIGVRDRHRRRQWPRIGVRDRRQRGGDADRPVPLGAPCALGSTGGLGRGRLRRGRAYGDAEEAGDG